MTKKIRENNPTPRQMKAAENYILYRNRQRFRTLREALLDAGFSFNNAGANGKAIILTRGVQTALINLGFNENAAKSVVSEILITGEEQNRLKAAEMVFKIFGTFAPEKHESKSFIYQILNEVKNGQFQPIIRRTGEGGDKEVSEEPFVEIKQSLLDKG